jgi:tetratricopeptide (TPR) repeat protein
VWIDKTQEVSSRASAYNTYIQKGFLNSFPDSAFVMANELISFGQSVNLKVIQAGGYAIKGTYYKNRGEVDSAIFWYEKSLTINQDLGRKEDIARMLSNIG